MEMNVQAVNQRLLSLGSKVQGITHISLYEHAEQNVTSYAEAIVYYGECLQRRFYLVTYGHLMDFFQRPKHNFFHSGMPLIIVRDLDANIIHEAIFVYLSEEQVCAQGDINKEVHQLYGVKFFQ